MSYTSGMDEADWRYPPSEPFASGQLDVTGGHRIWWEEHGRPDGEPVVFLHGGPGGGTVPAFARLFDPARYRVLLFDQRGCGKSTPSVADDPVAGLRENTTPHLIADIERLREFRGIERWHVFGGSWGSTLALAYAIAHPECAASLILRGIFLCRRIDLDFFYQGNAARLAEHPDDVSLPGAYLTYPEAWARFVAVIPPEERHDMIAAYARTFAGDDETKAQDAALAWSIWEGTTSYLAPKATDGDKFAEAAFARAFARIENHYFMNGAFLGGEGEANRDQNFILENAGRLKDIPVHIVHGRYDQVCPLFQAEALVAALRGAGNARVELHVTPAAHSMLERENHAALVSVMDGLAPL